MAVVLVTPVTNALSSVDLLDVCSPRVSHFRALLSWAVSIDVDDAATTRSGTDLDPIISDIVGINAVCLMIL